MDQFTIAVTKCQLPLFKVSPELEMLIALALFVLDEIYKLTALFRVLNENPDELLLTPPLLKILNDEPELSLVFTHALAVKLVELLKSNALIEPKSIVELEPLNNADVLLSTLVLPNVTLVGVPLKLFFETSAMLGAPDASFKRHEPTKPRERELMLE